MRAPLWNELVNLMVHGPDLPVRGRIRHADGAGDDAGAGWFTWAGNPPPAFPDVEGGLVDVWAQGARVRLVDPDGGLALVCDGTTAWHFTTPGEPPRESPRDHVTLVLGGTDLLTRSTAVRWLGDDFARPTGPARETVFVGRPAWTVELAPPPHKPHPLQLVVDAETGMVLQQRNDGFGSVSEWTELVVGEELDPALFTWDGPVVTWEQQRAEVAGRAEAEDRDRRQWVLDEFGSSTATLEIEVGIEIHHRDPDGTLHASLPPIASLSRRPRTDTRWDGIDDLGPDARVHRWSDPRWDWALQCWEAPMTEASLQALQTRLARLSAP